MPHLRLGLVELAVGAADAVDLSGHVGEIPDALEVGALRDCALQWRRLRRWI